MSSRTYHGELRPKPATQGDDPWLDDKTTATYRAPAGNKLTRRASAPVVIPSSTPPDWHRTGTQLRAALTPTVHSYRGSVQQRADTAVAKFWQEQDDGQREKITGRAMEPRWLRALAVVVGSLMCGVFARVLLTTPSAVELPTTASTSAPVAASEPQPAPTAIPAPIDAVAPQPEPEAPPSAAKAGSARKRSKSSSSKRSSKADSTSEATAASEQAAPATLRINSRPWSQIFVDGAPKGNTPQLAIELTPGEHRVRLHNPQLAATKIFTVRAQPGQVIERVEQLEP